MACQWRNGQTAGVYGYECWFSSESRTGSFLCWFSSFHVLWCFFLHLQRRSFLVHLFFCLSLISSEFPCLFIHCILSLSKLFHFFIFNFCWRIWHVTCSSVKSKDWAICWEIKLEMGLSRQLVSINLTNGYLSIQVIVVLLL